MIETQFISFDDGHHPGATIESSKLAVHKNKNSINFVSVFDDLIEDSWCEKIYQYSITKIKPWGVYITTLEALNETLKPHELYESNPEKAIALLAVRELIFNKGKQFIGKDLDAINGIAVWSLSSDASNAVEYHIDYAELYRYETNEIIPPWYAGTYHVSPITSVNEMKGGDFMVNSRGLKHYEQFGYKGRLGSAGALEEDIRSSRDWITVQYRHNRGILHDGNMPHLSTKVEFIDPTLRRVILGFNCFPGGAVSDCNRRAPEHSDAFNRTIKLYQAMAAIGASNAPPVESSVQNISSQNNNQSSVVAKDVIQSNQTSFNAKDVLRNPALAKLLLLAARKLKEMENNPS